MAQTRRAQVAGIAAIVITVSSFVFTVALAIDLTAERWRLYIFALIAATTQGILLCTLSHLLCRYCMRGKRRESGLSSRWGGRRIRLVVALGIIPSFVAGSLVGAVLMWSRANVSQQPQKILGSERATFLTLGIVWWAVAILTQAMFYFCLQQTGVNTKALQHPGNSDDVQIYPQMMENREPPSLGNQSIQIHELPMSTSSPPSLTASEGTSSLRSSLSMIPRPASSKTRLLIRQQSFPRQSNRFLDHPAPERVSHDGGFDSWDTSEVAPHIRETILQASPVTRGKPLEPIPGSRSPSPAKALEGPFYPETQLSSVPTSPLPQPTYSRNSSAQQPPRLDISLYRQSKSSSAPTSPLQQPNYSRPVSRQRTSSSEDHIHPLFRSCSPTPPPTASSNTVLTAAPEAGQIMSDRVMQRMRSGSLPSTTAMPLRSNSLGTHGPDLSWDQDARPMAEVMSVMSSPAAPVRLDRPAGWAS